MKGGCEATHSAAAFLVRCSALRPGREEIVTEDLRRRLCQELRSFERDLTEASLAEALRLLGSPVAAELTNDHVREIAAYRPIEVSGERFFERAWSRSKEAAATLGFALLLGTDTVREDLRRLAASLPRASEGLSD